MRFKDREWNVSNDDPPGYPGAHLAVLMDIRDELKALNRVFQCPNFIGLPKVVRKIETNTRAPKREKLKP